MMRSKLFAFGLIAIGIGVAGAHFLNSSLATRPQVWNERTPSSMMTSQEASSAKIGEASRAAEFR